MNIIVLGHKGQIGGALSTALSGLGRLYLPDFDLNHQEKLTAAIADFHPDIIVNAAAYTHVDDAEENKNLAFMTNAIMPRTIAMAAKDAQSLLIHFSTDYVFDGTGNSPWTENSPSAPLNIYGASKAEGDAAIIQSGCRHLIFRTSWVYSPIGNNFIRTILRLSQKNDTLRVVSDQVGCPNSAEFIARATLHAMNKTLDNPALQGLYNLSCPGETSWFDFAKLIISESGLNPACQIIPVTSSEYGSLARRPLNSRLNTSKFQNYFGLIPPDWKSEVTRNLPAILKGL